MGPTAAPPTRKALVGIRLGVPPKHGPAKPRKEKELVAGPPLEAPKTPSRPCRGMGLKTPPSPPEGFGNHPAPPPPPLGFFFSP